MSLTNGIIDAPVGMEAGVGDIERALGVSSGHLNELCTSDRINMWAKFKPVRYANQNTLPQLSNDAWKQDKDFSPSNTAWWWGDYDFGIDFTNAGIAVSTGQAQNMKVCLQNLVSKIDGGDNGWGRRKPRGSSGKMPNPNEQSDLSTQRNEWYREVDFKEYNHKAPTPVRKANISTDTVQASDNGDWDISVGMMTATNSDINERDYIFPWDVLTLWANKFIGKPEATSHPMYLGFAIYKVDNGEYTTLGWVTGTTDGSGMEFFGRGILNRDALPGADYSEDDYVAIMKLRNGGNYAVLPFLCTKELPQPTNNNDEIMPNYSVQSGQCMIYTCPNTTFLTFTAVQSATTQMIGKPTLSNKKILASGNYTATVYMDATDTSYYVGGTIPTGQLRVMVVNNLYTEGGDVTQNNCKFDQSNNSPITITAGTKVSVMSISVQNLDQTKDWKVYVWVIGQPMAFALLQTPILIEQEPSNL